MANNTNPVAIAFSDDQLRPLGDKLAQVYFLCKAVTAEWTAKGIGALIPDNADLIADKSVTAGDGRSPISGTDVNALASLVVAFTADMEASANAKLNSVLKIAVNPTR